MEKTPDHFKQKPKTLPPSANDLFDKAHHRLSTESKDTSPTVEPLKLPLLERLWVVMTETYGHRWTSSFGEIAEPDHAWAKHLSGITGQQIARGLEILSGMALEWPPSAPEFRKLCAQVPGMPSIDDAWIEALKGVYSHPAVKIAAEATGLFELREAKPTNKILYQQFERNYAIVMRRAQTGQSLEGRVAKGISHDGKTPYQAQLAQSHREARDLLIAQNIPTDPKAARALLLARVGIRRSPNA